MAHAILRQVNVHVCQAELDGVVISVNLAFMDFQTARSAIVMRMVLLGVIRTLEDAFVK